MHGPAEQLRKTDERLIRYQLNLFIRDVRSVFSDAEVQKTVINRAYGHAKDSALGFLNDYFKKSNPFLREAEGTVTVQVQSVLRLSASSWQVQWRETQLAPGGRVVSETSWQAVLGVELTPPETTDVLLVNPLGLYELLNYAYTKPEGGLVSPLSESGCRPCSAFEAESDSLARDGRRYASEVLTIKHVIFTTEDIDNPWVTVSGHQNEVPIIEKDGTLTSAAPAEDVTFRVVLRWTSSGWRVEDLVSV